MADTGLRLPKRVLNFSRCLSPACPPDWWPLHFNKPFPQESSPLSPRRQLRRLVHLLRPFLSRNPPTGMCPARQCLPAWAFRGVSVSPWQLLAPCASPPRAAGRQHAGRCFTHPGAPPLRTLPYSGPPPHLALVWNSSFGHISDSGLMRRQKIWLGLIACGWHACQHETTLTWQHVSHISCISFFIATVSFQTAQPSAH